MKISRSKLKDALIELFQEDAEDTDTVIQNASDICADFMCGKNRQRLVEKIISKCSNDKILEIENK